MKAMKKLFGTDGIRAVAGEPPLDDRTIYAVGLALAHTLSRTTEQPHLLLGMDTRESSDHIAAVLTAGLTAGGAVVSSAGIITTPAVAYLTVARGYQAGVVISASHNPWQDNGIKLFGPDGYKLPDAVELEMEAEIFRHLPEVTVPQTGLAAPEVDESMRVEYVRSLLAAVPELSLGSMCIVVDCANGAASAVAPELFGELIARHGGEVRFTHASPNGRNINEACGALHADVVAAEVAAQKASLGVTFDGDADRSLFADEHGRVVNGDAVLLLAGRHLQSQGKLAGDIVVATTMSNMGLEAALKRSGIRMLRAPVGDKYVLEQMQATGASLGGEQSGHILFAGRSTTGDGLLTALLLLEIVARSGKTLGALTEDLKVFPQVIVNVRVAERRPLESIESVVQAIRTAEAELSGTGRVVVRYSGTEPLARIMVEAEDEQQMHHHAHAIESAIREQLGM
jgi:phosphoglucosamine mutase